MVYKILIDIEAIFGLPQLHPCRFDVCRAVTLLQKEDIRNNLGACIFLKSVVG